MWKYKILVLGISFATAAAASTKDTKICTIDDSVSSNDPENVYRCDAADKCCIEDGNPTCCQEKPTDAAAWDQVKLWGSIAGILLLVVISIFFCRRDIEILGEDSRCCCCKKHSQFENEELEPEDKGRRPMSTPTFVPPPQKPKPVQPAADDGGHIDNLGPRPDSPDMQPTLQPFEY